MELTTASTSDPNPQTTLHALLKTDMLTPIPPSLLSPLLTSPPFIPSPIPNLRTPSTLTPLLRPNLLYRSAAIPPSTPPQTLQHLRTTLNISTILDLRYPREVAAAPDPVIPGITGLWFPPEGAERAIELDRFQEDGGVSGYVDMYRDMLRVCAPAIKGCLTWLLEWKEGDGGLLVHCNAGKDRAGLLTAILLSLAGIPTPIIAHDYSLSRIGLEPERDRLLAQLKMWRPDWSEDTPGMREFAQCRGEVMEGTLEMLGEFGGVEGFVRGLGFTGEDVRRLRGVLRADG